ncbi:MAG: thiamine diphosphokinase [Chloroflexota bacterium]|nr:thiamine diphosphokinase [Chloroflexota bacterium]
MKALVVADGEVPALEELGPELPPAAGDEEFVVIAANGGLRKAQALGLHVDLVVGDADSLAPTTIASLAEQGVELQRHAMAKDASDTELALREAVRRGAAEVFLVGALGGPRFDHALANVLLLAAPDLSVPVTVLDRATTVRVIGGPEGGRLQLLGRAGDIVSLLPLGTDVEGVTLTGLEYSLHGGTLPGGSSLGLSNVLTGPSAEISVTRGRLVAIHIRQGARA